jgi:hypothetical protein
MIGFIDTSLQLQQIKAENTAVGVRCVDHATPSIRKNWH